MNIIYKPSNCKREITNKTQIVLHAGIYRCFFSEKMPHYYIQKNGEIINFYDEKFWEEHLTALENISTKNCINKISISIVIESLGPAYYDHLSKKFLSHHYLNNQVSNVYEFCSNAKFRGHQYYDFITAEQIQSLGKLLLFLAKEYNIPSTYNSDMWHFSENALKGTPGIWTHNSFRSDVLDPHPQIELVNLLKSL